MASNRLQFGQGQAEWICDRDWLARRHESRNECRPSSEDWTTSPQGLGNLRPTSRIVVGAGDEHYICGVRAQNGWYRREMSPARAWTLCSCDFALGVPSLHEYVGACDTDNDI